MITAIVDRRSIRKYKDIDVPRHMIEEILQAGILAPSSKNRQPWKFIVAAGDTKKNILETMVKGINREREHPLLPQSAQYRSSACNTLRIMKRAPVIIFIVNPLGADINATLTPEERIYEICNAQSIGAAIENMTLTATELGLGSLWICDTYFAYEELCNELHIDGALYAAMAVGYADEAPSTRPRNKMFDVVEWRN